MQRLETLEIIIADEWITYPTDKPWLETWYGSHSLTTLPKLEAAGWKQIAARPLIGVGTTRMLYVLQRRFAEAESLSE